MSSALSVEKLVSDAKETASKLSIKKFDIYGAIIDETSAEVDSGAPKQVSASNRASITVRVWNDEGTVGVTSTTNIDRIGLELALQSAHEASFFGAKENIPDFNLTVSLSTCLFSGNIGKACIITLDNQSPSDKCLCHI